MKFIQYSRKDSFGPYHFISRNFPRGIRKKIPDKGMIKRLGVYAERQIDEQLSIIIYDDDLIVRVNVGDWIIVDDNDCLLNNLSYLGDRQFREKGEKVRTDFHLSFGVESNKAILPLPNFREIDEDEVV